jgi:hypothetical protein
MAHFAEINSEGIVQRVIVVNNSDCLDENKQESEAVGAAFCNNLLGGVWKQTSYNGNIRKNYAGIGYKYDEELDAFIPPKPFSKWILNEETAQWEAPTPMPEGSEEDRYVWNDNQGEWEQVVVE